MKKYTIKKLSIGVLSVGLIFSGLSLNSFENIFAKNISASATANSKNVKIEVFEVDGKVEFKFTALKNLENVEIKTTVDGETKVYKYKELKKGQETTEKQTLKTEKEILEAIKNKEKLAENKQKSGSKTLPKTAPASNLEEVVEKLNADFGIHKVDIELKYYIEKTVNEELEKLLTSSLYNNTNNITSDQQDKEARFRELLEKNPYFKELLLSEIFFLSGSFEDKEYWDFLTLGFDLNKGEDFKKAIITYVGAFWVKGPIHRHTKEHIIYYKKSLNSYNGKLSDNAKNTIKYVNYEYEEIIKLSKNNEGFYEREKAFELELKKLNEKFASADGKVAKFKVLGEQLNSIVDFTETYVVDEENINSKIEQDKQKADKKYQKLYNDLYKKYRELYEFVYQDNDRIRKEFNNKMEEFRKTTVSLGDYERLELRAKKEYLETKIKLLLEIKKYDNILPKLNDTKDILYPVKTYMEGHLRGYNNYYNETIAELDKIKKQIEAQEQEETSEPAPTEPSAETTN